MRLASIEPEHGTAAEMPSRRSLIRRATVDDLVRMVPGARKFFAEAKLPGIFRPDIWMSYWHSFLSSGIGVVFVAELGEEIIGGIGALIHPDICTGEKSAVETFWFMSPSHRGQGIKLIFCLESWAKENGIKRLSLAHFAHLNAETLNKLYLRLGYEPVDITYGKCLPSRQ